MKYNFHPKGTIRMYLSEIPLFVDNIFGTSLDLIKENPDILPQDTHRQQLNAAKENNRCHNGSPATFRITEPVYLPERKPGSQNDTDHDGYKT